MGPAPLEAEAGPPPPASGAGLPSRGPPRPLLSGSCRARSRYDSVLGPFRPTHGAVFGREEEVLQPPRPLAVPLRTLRKNRAFSIGVVLIMTLVVGGSTALFSSLYGLAFPRLPFRSPGRLVFVEEVNKSTGAEPVSVGAFRAVQAQARSLEDVSAFLNPSPADWLYSDRLWGTQETVSIAGCTSGLFRLLDVAPALGRPFLAADEREGAATVAVLSNRFWRSHYGASRNVLGRVIAADDFGRRVEYPIVGVMPPGFGFPYPLSPERPDFWVSLHASASSPTSLLGSAFGVIAHLRPGFSMANAQAEVRAISERIHEQYPQYYKNETMRIVSLRSELVRDDKTVLTVLGCTMGLILLVGCANLGGMLLARAVGRERETALRAALGASKGALIRQACAETALLVLTGSALGALTAYGVLRAYFAYAPEALRAVRIGSGLSGFWVLLCVGLASAGVAFLAAITPSLARSSPDLNSLLRAGARRARSSGTAVFPRSGSVLLVLQVALGLTLLAGTFALTGDLRRLLDADSTFSPSNLVTIEVGLANTVPNEPAYVGGLFRQLLQRVEAIPGVRAAALSDGFPLPGLVFTSFTAPGSSGAIGESYQPAEVHAVSPNFFETVGFRLVRGRFFDSADSLSSQPVAVVNTSMMRRYWPGGDPIGRTLRSSLSQGVTGRSAFKIIGVIHEPLRFGTGNRAPPAVYISLLQTPWRWVTVVARAHGDPRGVAGALREAALEVAPGETYLGPVRTGEDLVAQSSARVRLTTALVASFGLLALVLLAVGTYGMVSYHAAKRTREIGIRLALGATPIRARLLVVRQGMSLVSLGVFLGLLGAFLFAKSVSSLLYGVQLRGLAAYGGSAALVLVTALVACYVPARRAAGVDPASTLREE